MESRLKIGDKWYAKPFDRGHLVRRLDPAWGRTKAFAGKPFSHGAYLTGLTALAIGRDSGLRITNGPNPCPIFEPSSVLTCLLALLITSSAMITC